MRTQRWWTAPRSWIGVSAGMALGLGGVILAQHVDAPADAAPVRVSAEQLTINQRISQAAVRRSNESLNLLDPVRKSGAQDDAPGWGTQELRDGAVTAAKLDAAVRETVPRFAVVAATTGALVRARGAVSAAKAADPGRYTVTFDRDVSACAYQVTIAPGGTDPVPVGQVSAWRSATDPKTVTVRTAADDAVSGVPEDLNTLPFHLTVQC